MPYVVCLLPMGDTSPIGGIFISSCRIDDIYWRMFYYHHKGVAVEKSNHTAIDAAKKLLYEGMPLLRPNDASPKEVEYSDRVVVWSKC